MPYFEIALAIVGMSLYFNAGNMSFSTIQIPLPFDGGGITARDMNGDGLIDLIVGMGTWGFSSNVWTSGQVAVFLGLGGGAFSPPDSGMAQGPAWPSQP